MPPEPDEHFDLGAVERAIAGTSFAESLLHFAVLPSTQTLASEAAQAGARGGVWIADQQTAGRGRGSHSWHSRTQDGLYFSALVAPALPLPNALRLSLVTALAAQAAIAEVAGFRPREEIDIRWPNDLILHGRKVGGILIESTASPAPAGDQPPMLRYAVIGVGINCNQLSFPPELDAIATSLRRESPPPASPIARESILAALLRQLDAQIRSLVREWHAGNGTPPGELERYSSWLRGKRVHVPEDGGYTGITAGLNPDGFLLVAADDGTLRTVRSGGVREP